MKTKINFKTLIISIAVVFLIAFIGSLFTSPVTDSQWYLNNKPSITPPNFIFPTVWNILFLLISFSLYLSWINSNKKQKKKIAIIFGINLFLNVFWSFLFFTLQKPAWAFAELIVLWISILAMILTTWRIDRKASYMLIPYLVWVSFAGVLNLLWAL